MTQLKRSVVIIGAGFSGMSAAAFMAKQGWSVTIVEKNSTAGGRARQFSADGFTFDMGPSWYWMPEVFENFFSKFGKSVADYYKLVRLDPSYRVYWEREHTDLSADYDEIRQTFESIEPGSAAKLDEYLEEAAVKYEIGMNQFVFKPGLSITEFFSWEVLKNSLKLNIFTSISNSISRKFANPKLRQILEFPVLFLGALPRDTPALYSLMNHADMKGGTWYPEGGMYSVVAAMQQLCEDLGVVFRFDEDAIKIDVVNDSAKALITKNGRIDADVIVSAADYHFTETNLLESKYRSYSSEYWNRRALAPSCLIYYVGLDRKLNNVLHHSLFFDVPFDQHASEIYDSPKWPTKPLFYMCTPSQTDATVAPADHENLFILIPVASGLDGDNEALRDHYFDAVIMRLEERLESEIKSHIVYKRSYATSDFISDYNSYKGNAYGLANTLLQTAIFKPSCRSKKINNLFYTGQFTVPGPGVPPAIISGEVVAGVIDKLYK